MFVFPALNSNFKSRKRAFRCCQLCRIKRTKCDITSPDFESTGCASCRNHGWKCSFVKKFGLGQERTPEDLALPDALQNSHQLAPLDMKNVNLRHLKDTFNFNSSGPDSDSAYQYVFQHHPKAIINDKIADTSAWHESGVFVDSKDSKKTGFWSREKEYHIRSRKTYNYLVLIHAFTLSSPEFDLTAYETTRLLQIYFFKINSIFPIVHEKRFWDDYHSNKAQNIIIYSMVLLILRDKLAEPLLKDMFLRCKNKLENTNRLEITTEEFDEDLVSFMRDLDTKIRQINLVLPELGDVDKLTRLVVSLLLSLNYRFDRLGNEQSSHDVTAALNLALSLAIHMKPTNHENFTQERIEYSANLWWVCFVFDRFNAISNCRSIFVKHEDFNVDFPYSNIHLLRMVQLARAFEHMLTATYRPYNNIHMSDLNNDLQNRLKIFNVDEFQKLEFDFCDKEIASGNPVFATVPNPHDLGNLLFYLSNSSHFMTRLINNTAIMIAQKMRFDDPSVPKDIPERVVLKAAANVLWYVHQMDDAWKLNFPLITWSLLLAMASHMKRRAKLQLEGTRMELDAATPKYEVEDFLMELEKYAGTWWIVDEVCNLSRDFMDKVTRTQKRKCNGASLPPKRIIVEISPDPTSASPPLQRMPLVPSITNIVHAMELPSEFPEIFPDTAQRTDYDQYFSPTLAEIFDNEFFKDVPNLVNILR